jgi:hypothetical protein
MKKFGIMMAMASAIALAACSGEPKEDAAAETGEVSAEATPAESGTAGEIPETAAEGAAKDEAMAETEAVPTDKSPAEGGTMGEIPETAEEGAAKDAAMAEDDVLDDAQTAERMKQNPKAN